LLPLDRRTHRNAHGEVRTPQSGLWPPDVLRDSLRGQDERREVLFRQGLQGGRSLAQPHFHHQHRSGVVLQVLDGSNLVGVQARVQVSALAAGGVEARGQGPVQAEGQSEGAGCPHLPLQASITVSTICAATSLQSEHWHPLSSPKLNPSIKASSARWRENRSVSISSRSARCLANCASCVCLFITSS